MTLKDRAKLLKTPQEVDTFLRENAVAAIFKAGMCHKSPTTFEAVERHLGAREDIPLGIIRVVEWRPASNHVETLTGIRHESPQFILFRDGKAVFDRDNWDITDEAVEQSLEGVAAAAPR